MRRLFMLILAGLLALGGCASGAAYTESEIYQIVDETLTYAESANQRLLETMDNNVLNASMIEWRHQPLEIVTNDPDKLTVLLQGEFILTGTTTALPLTLTRQDGRWLIDESFYPLEQLPADYYYGEAELQRIIEQVLRQAERAEEVPVIYSDENREIMRDAFLTPVADRYYDDLGVIGQPPASRNDWQADEYWVWLNQRDKIVVIMRYGDEYRPLNLYLVGSRWLTDESYRKAGQFAAVPAILPFAKSDLQFPFDGEITPEQFVKLYGRPFAIETDEYLDDTDRTTFSYDEFSISWIHWLESDHYVINNITSRTPTIWPELRGVRLGDSTDSVIGKFHHHKPAYEIDVTFGLPILYGAFYDTWDYGLIDDNTLLYATGNEVLRLIFVDDKLQGLEYQVLD